MRNILLFLLFFVFLSDISAQTRAGLLNITSFPTALSGNRFRITNATFNDPTGESTASNVTESWVLWKSNHRFTVDTIENVSGSLITLVVNDVDLVGFLSTGIANLGSVNTDGTINVAPTGDSNSSYITPSDNASLNRYNLNKTATQTLGSTIVNSINNQLGSNGWQSGIQLDTIIQSLHGFSVSSRKFYPVRPDNAGTWYNTSASAEMFFPSAYVVDSLNANTFVVQYSGRLLISGGHGYTVGSKLYLDNTGNPNTTAGTKKLLLATVPNDSVLILQPVPIESGTTQTGSQIVTSINSELGSTDWQTGGIADLGVGETITVYAPNHGLIEPDYGIIPIYQKNDTVFREANLLNKDSIYTLFVVNVPSTDSLTIQKSGYVVHAGHGLSKGTYYMDFWNKISTTKDEYLEVKVFDVLNDSTMALGNGLGIQYRKPTRNAINAKYAEALAYATTNGYTQPSDEVKAIQNTLLTTLTDLGVMDEMDYFYLFANDGYDAFARINLADSSKCYVLKSGDMLHNAKLGYGIDPSGSTGGYLNPQFNSRLSPNGQAVHSSINDVSRGIYLTQIGKNKNYYNGVGGVGQGSQIWVRGDANRMYVTLWSSESNDFLTAVEATGLWYGIRQNGTDAYFYHDNTNIGSTTQTAISWIFGTQPQQYFFNSSAANQNAAANKDVYLGLEYYGAGAAINADKAAFNTAIQTYFTALNAL